MRFPAFVLFVATVGSCLGTPAHAAGRAAFLGGNCPVRTGMTKVGLPGAKEGWQKIDVRIATVLKGRGDATGRDPFERAQHNATVSNDWFLDHAFEAAPLQQLAGRFLMPMQDYPPSQAPGSFNLAKIQKQLEAAAGAR